MLTCIQNGACRRFGYNQNGAKSKTATHQNGDKFKTVSPFWICCRLGYKSTQCFFREIKLDVSPFWLSPFWIQPNWRHTKTTGYVAILDVSPFWKCRRFGCRHFDRYPPGAPPPPPPPDGTKHAHILLNFGCLIVSYGICFKL